MICMAQTQQVQKKQQSNKAAAEKKWKGKDWFNIEVPPWLGTGRIAVTPATDAKSIPGRIIEVAVPDVTGDQSKYYIRIELKTGLPKENMDVPTTFHSYYCLGEYVMRLGRKGLGKVAAYVNCETKDGWKLQASAVCVLNRRSNANIKTKIIALMEEMIKAKASELSHSDLIKAVMAGVVQMKIKKAASKTYPVRFAEITKIEVLKAGS
jgi:small subunit ribosomal protein S3Ae